METNLYENICFPYNKNGVYFMSGFHLHLCKMTTSNTSGQGETLEGHVIHVSLEYVEVRNII